MAKVHIPAELMPPVEHPEHTREAVLADLGTDATTPVAVVLQADDDVYAYVQLCRSLEHAEELYADSRHVLGCDCGRSCRVQQMCNPDFPLLPCGHTLRLIALEALPAPIKVECPMCAYSFEVEV